MKKQYFLITICFLFFATSNAQLEGTLNNQFSQDGWDASVYGNNNGFTLSKTIIQPDGKILICAEGNYSNEGSQAIVIRYNVDGTIDTTFGGGDGMVRSNDDSDTELYSRAVGMALQSNGKIVIVGDVFYNSERIFRLNTDGSLDTSFGTNGLVNMPRSNSEYSYHVAVQSDDKIIVCGSERRRINGIDEWGVFVWRFTANGVLDTTFGTDGAVSNVSSQWIGLGEIYLQVNELLVLPNDKIVVNQTFSKAGENFVMLTKYNANGSKDLSYGSNGESLKSAVPIDGYNISCSVLQADGSIISSITVGNQEEGVATEFLYRTDAAGNLDPSLNLNLGNPTNIATYLQLIISGQKLYVIRKVYSNAPGFEEIRCFDLNGNPITNFGNNGVALINQNDIPASQISTKSAIASDGNIYLATYISDPDNPNNYRFLVSNVIGFNPNLSLSDQNSSLKIGISPNPSTGIFNMLFDSSIQLSTIKVTDLNGRIVYESVSQNLDGEMLDLSNLQTGMYLLNIDNALFHQTKKIIKQ